jgi:phenylpropionate dioxygenase-like ring-hydroxylating dioxygenase large terminal subunit
MFTHQQHLRHLLQPEHYTSDAQYRAELRHVFHPAWHPLAVKSELARPGDFLTFHLLETPILIRNFDGELRAFLNVCPHRHSQLTDKQRGNSAKLRCQYHGWEYAADGHTAKIPEARAFRPWDRDNSCLRRFHLDTCGDLVFVNFSDNPVSLREWIGPYWDGWQTYGGRYRHAATWEADFPCNWKIVLENSLESYHIPQVHPHTFKKYPEEANAWHELDENYSTFKTMTPPDDWGGRVEQWFIRRLGEPVTGEYFHRVRHPHATGSQLDSFRMMQCVFPTGPQSCRYRCIFFTLRGRRSNPLAWLFYRILKSAAKLVAKKVFLEDAAIYESVQKGIAASPHPGVIGTREERIYYFQKYVLDACRGASELPMANGVPVNRLLEIGVRGEG